MRQIFCRPYIGTDSDSGYSPPPQIFKKEARAAQLFAPLFSFDRFRLYSLLYFGEYSQKRSNFLPILANIIELRMIVAKEQKYLQFLTNRFTQFVPHLRNLNFWQIHIQIFGGNNEKKQFVEDFCKKFFNVARALPRYSVSSFLETNRKGVST